MASQGICSHHSEEVLISAQDMSLPESKSPSSLTTLLLDSGEKPTKIKQNQNPFPEGNSNLFSLYGFPIPSWVPSNKDKLIFFPTTRIVKRYPINVESCKSVCVRKPEVIETGKGVGRGENQQEEDGFSDGRGDNAKFNQFDIRYSEKLCNVRWISKQMRTYVYF